MSTVAAEKPAALSKAAIFVTGSKGGPGKSTFSTLLVDYYRSRGITTAAYDGDHNNMTLLQFYGTRGEDGKLVEDQDAVNGVKVFNIRQPDERDLMLNVVEGAATRIVIDLPGGAVRMSQPSFLIPRSSSRHSSTLASRRSSRWSCRT
jgi:cellulose biosynthesis protein BcsQ